MQTSSVSSAHVAELPSVRDREDRMQEERKMLRERTTILIKQQKVQFYINMKDKILLLSHLKALKICFPSC